MNKYLLDTCFILALYKNHEDALRLIQNISFEQCYISVVNRIELLGYHQITPQDEQELTAFLNQLICLELSQSVQDKAIEVRKFHKIKLADSIVLATALAHDLELLTLNNGLNNKFLKERNIYF